jgi:hypothetical protein
MLVRQVIGSEINKMDLRKFLNFLEKGLQIIKFI